MFQTQLSGKIVAVFDGKPNPDGSVPLIADVQHKSFQNGKLVTINWRLLAPRHKEKWLKMQMDKGYTIICVLSGITFYDDRAVENEKVPHGYGALQEVLTL